MLCLIAAFGRGKNGFMVSEMTEVCVVLHPIYWNENETYN